MHYNSTKFTHTLGIYKVLTYSISNSKYINIFSLNLNPFQKEGELNHFFACGNLTGQIVMVASKT